MRDSQQLNAPGECQVRRPIPHLARTLPAPGAEHNGSPGAEQNGSPGAEQNGCDRSSWRRREQPARDCNCCLLAPSWQQFLSSLDLLSSFAEAGGKLPLIKKSGGMEEPLQNNPGLKHLFFFFLILSLNQN